MTERSLSSSSPQPTTDNWEVERIRVTTFISLQPMKKITENTWWEETVGNKPEESFVSHQKGVKEQKGMLGNNLLILTCQPDRIDWNVMIGQQPSSDEPFQFPTIGSLPDVLKSLSSVVKKWLDVCPPTNRLALGATLVKTIADIKTGHEEILQYLPDLKLNPTGISDFFYQINRPRESTSSVGIKINRLSKWSIMQIGTVRINVGSQVDVVPVNEQRQNACKLELDINTAPSDNIISKDATWPIFEELAEYGREIALKGDIP